MTRCLNLAALRHSDMCDGCRTAYDSIYVKPTQEYVDHYHLTVTEILRKFRCAGRKKEATAIR